MKRKNGFITFILFCVSVMMLFSFSVAAITPREMLENGEVSDGGIVYGDERDGIVSDVSSEMGDLGSEISEFGESMMPDMDKTTDESTTVESTTERVTTHDTSREPMNQTEQNSVNDTSGEANRKDAKLGIIIAVLIVIAVVAVIFMLFRRK